MLCISGDLQTPWLLTANFSLLTWSVRCCHPPPVLCARIRYADVGVRRAAPTSGGVRRGPACVASIVPLISFLPSEPLLRVVWGDGPTCVATLFISAVEPLLRVVERRSYIISFFPNRFFYPQLGANRRYVDLFFFFPNRFFYPQLGANRRSMDFENARII